MRDLCLLSDGFNKSDQWITNTGWTIANRVSVRWDTFDKQPLLATDSGVFYVENGKLAGRGYQREDFSTQYLPQTVGGECPRWLEMMNQLLPNKTDQKCLRQFMGYVMFPGYQLQTICHLHGLEGTGKSTIVSILEAILGPKRVSHNPMSLIGLDAHGISGDIVDAWVNIDAQTEIVDKVAEKYVKAISGGDPVTVNEKYLKKYSKRLNVKLVIVSNDMPRFHDKTNALWSRVVVIPFNILQAGDKSIDSLIDELRPEFGGIIRWAFAGLVDLLRNKGFRSKVFAKSKQALELLQENKETSNPFLLWVQDAVVEAEGNIVFGQEVFDDYRCWCHRCGHTGILSFPVSAN